MVSSTHRACLVDEVEVANLNANKLRAKSRVAGDKNGPQSLERFFNVLPKLTLLLPVGVSSPHSDVYSNEITALCAS